MEYANWKMHLEEKFEKIHEAQERKIEVLNEEKVLLWGEMNEKEKVLLCNLEKEKLEKNHIEENIEILESQIQELK